MAFLSKKGATAAEAEAKLSPRERLALPEWQAALAVDSADIRFVTNGDGGTILKLGADMPNISPGVFVITEGRIAYVYRDKKKNQKRVVCTSRSLHEVHALTSSKDGQFQISFFRVGTPPHDFWWVPGNHEELLDGFRLVRQKMSISVS